MGSLRHFALIVFLAGVGWAVYVALHKPPKTPDRLDVAPAWNPPQLNTGLAAGAPDSGKTGLPPLLVPSLSTTATAPAAAVAGGSVATAAAVPAISASSSAPAPTAATAPSSSGSLAAVAATVAPSSSAVLSAAPPAPATSTSASVAPAQPYASAAAAAAALLQSPQTPATPPPVNGIAPVSAPTSPQKPLDEPGFATVAGGAGLPSAAAAPAPPPAANPATAVSSSAAAPTAAPPTAAPPTTAPPTTTPPPVQPAAPATASASPQSPPAAATPLAEALKAASGPLEAGRYAEALTILSKFYRNAIASPALSADDGRQLVAILDQLAGTVIYSREHLLAPPHRVQSGETVDSIARRYNVSAELLAKINGLRDAAQLAPGVELKVVPGPFEAVVDLNRYELALFVGERYAGRFSVGFGQDQPLAEGQFVVREKQLNPFYRGVDRIFTGGDPNNPLGRRRLDLGGVVAIHGTDDPRNIGRTEGRGAIRLGERDITDVYDILTVGSVVTLRR